MTTGDQSKRQSLSYQAMATTFTVIVDHPDWIYARQAIAAAFTELDLLENHLSRFVESSDIFRINRLGPGESTLVHLDTFECLRMALDLQGATGGAFDVAYASARLSAPRPRIELDARKIAVRVLVAGTRLDLGGVGKGFALDRMAALLKKWGLDSALLCASASTVLALGPPLPTARPHERRRLEDGFDTVCAVGGSPQAKAGSAANTTGRRQEFGWPISFGPDHDRRQRGLANAAFSGSGRAVKGNHIINPRTGRPAEGCYRAWAGAPTATVADALSTAFMVMTEAEIQRFCQRHPTVSAYVQQNPSGALLAIAEGITR